jgi:hypothetical protein
MKNIKVTVRKYFTESAETVLYINSGTEENPDYHPIRGTNNNENLHKFVNALDLHLLSLELQEACYCRVLFRYSHNKRVRVRKLDLVNDLYDPSQMNELKLLQDEMRAKFSITFDSDYLVDHVILTNANASECLSGFKFQNPTSAIGTAARFLDPERLVEEWFEFPPGLETSTLLQGMNRNLDIQTLPRGTAFTHDDEYKLLRMLLSTNKFWEKKKLVSADDDGVTTAGWKMLATGKLCDLVDAEKLASHWNILVCNADGGKETVLTVDGDTISTENIKLKERVHIRAGIAKYAERVAWRAADLPRVPPAVIVERRDISVLVAPVPIPVPSATAAECLTAPPTIPTSEPTAVNRNLTARKSTKIRTNVIQEAPKSASAAKKQKRENKECPECLVAKHKQGCAFFAWKMDSKKPESVVRERINGVQESIHEAHRKYWLKHCVQLRGKYLPSS